MDQTADLVHEAKIESVKVSGPVSARARLLESLDCLCYGSNNHSHPIRTRSLVPSATLL
jgi:hypothetical protein